MASGMDENLFTFVWTIENWKLSAKKKGDFISGPRFYVKKFLDTKWFMRFYPKGAKDSEESGVSCSVKYARSGSPEKVKVTYELFFTDNPFNSPKFSKKRTSVFAKETESEILTVKRDVLNVCEFSNKKNICVGCYIWMQDADIGKHILEEGSVNSHFLNKSSNQLSPQPNFSHEIAQHVGRNSMEIQNKISLLPSKCFARCKISVQKEMFSWSLDNISKLPDKKNSIIIFPVLDDIPDLLLTTFLKSQNSVQVNVQTVTTYSSAFATLCKISVLDCCGKIQFSSEKNHYFEFDSKINGFELHSPIKKPKKENLSCGHNLFYLNCEIIISNQSISSCIEEFPNNELFSISPQPDCDTNLKERMLKVYESAEYCDAILGFEEKEDGTGDLSCIEAHKAIICANSPVLKDLFQPEEPGGSVGGVGINDVDENTMERMIKFMYTDIVPDMTFDETISLYLAAIHYEVLPLKQKCGVLLLSKLNVLNVCRAFEVSDLHDDKQLQDSILRYISQHLREVLLTKEWQSLQNNNTCLANVILNEMCTKFSKISI